jgi:hypothetical protein
LRKTLDIFKQGVAKESVPWLSKLFLYWVNPLIVKGRRGKISSADDVFDLPVKSSAPEVGEKFWCRCHKTFLRC